MLPESQLTTGQIAARARIARLYGGDAERYWRDHLRQVAAYEVVMRDKRDTLSDEEYKVVKRLQRNFMRGLKALGISFDLDTLYAEEIKRNEKIKDSDA